MALSYYRTGEVDLSRQAAQSAVRAFEVSEARDGRGIIEQAQSARDLLRRLDEWERQPVQLAPQSLHFSDKALSQLVGLGTEPNALVVRTFQVRTLTAEPLRVESDNLGVKAELFEDARPDAFAVVRELRVAVPLRLLQQGIQAHVTLGRAGDPQTLATLPVTSRDQNRAPDQTK